MDEVNGTSWRELATSKLGSGSPLSILFGPIKVPDGETNETVQFPGSAVLIFMLRWFLIQRIKEHKILDLYDRFVVTRTDHYYVCRHDFASLDLSGNRIWLPVGEDWGGYTDRHMVVGGDNLIDALDMMTDMILRPFDPSPHLTRPVGGTLRFGMHHNGEAFMRHVWGMRNLTVSRFPRVMYVCATAADKSDFMTATLESEHAPGLLAKYGEEYDVARRCIDHPEMRPDPVDFCGGCRWLEAAFDCEERVNHFASAYRTSREVAIRSEMEEGRCLHEVNVTS